MRQEDLSWLESLGILEWSGMDSSGDRAFSINHQRLNELYPSVYDAFSKDFYKILDLLYTMGYLHVYVEQNEVRYSITKKGNKLINKYKKGRD